MSKNIPTYIKFYLILILVGLIGGYIVYNSRILIKGPIIEVQSPENGSAVTEKITKIEGRTANTTYIAINDRSITIDETGFFSETLLLSPGYNIITIRANDKFNREVTEQLELYFKKSPDDAADSTIEDEERSGLDVEESELEGDEEDVEENL